ncbi:arrestin domain-containing protein 3-like [Patiria miniata]|uniref:Arrestin C-terminal-like domain-containing protein n=1 Tax=Patiria miniata TaxID=46514 RepID=A0A914ATC5_PATMI|nr:arrestin domain-containing protein 3-like [Patiria miniata]
MGKLRVFEVIFDGDDIGVFQSGEVIRGFIKIVLDEAKNDVRGIQIKFVGEAYTHWSEGSGKDSTSYSGREVYFKEKVICWGKGKHHVGASSLSLESGEHHFPFSFQIPNVPLPFPFESPMGWIRYKVVCKIDRPWKFDHHTERLFTVIGIPMDLNQMPHARYPSRAESSKTICCLCCGQGPITTIASTDKGAYVPGQSIFVSGTVHNNSSRSIVDLAVKLIQIVTYFSSGRSHTTRRTTLVKDKGPGCGAWEVATMDWKPLVIPSIPPSGPQGCNIIKIEYQIQFVGGISSTNWDAEVIVPVTIGTIPLHPTSYTDPSAVVIDQPSSIANVSIVPASPLPSYQVACGGLREIPSKSGHDYTFGKLMYAPQYPTYNLPAQPPSWNPTQPPQAPGSRQAILQLTGH